MGQMNMGMQGMRMQGQNMGMQGQNMGMRNMGMQGQNMGMQGMGRNGMGGNTMQNQGQQQQAGLQPNNEQYIPPNNGQPQQQPSQQPAQQPVVSAPVQQSQGSQYPEDSSSGHSDFDYVPADEIMTEYVKRR